MLQQMVCLYQTVFNENPHKRQKLGIIFPKNDSPGHSKILIFLYDLQIGLIAIIKS